MAERNVFIDGDYQYEEYRKNNLLHRDGNLPAQIIYDFRNGNIIEQNFFQNGVQIEPPSSYNEISYYDEEESELYDPHLILSKPNNRCGTSFAIVEQTPHNELSEIYFIEYDNKTFCYSYGELKAIQIILNKHLSPRDEIAQLDRTMIYYQPLYNEKYFNEIKNLV